MGVLKLGSINGPEDLCTALFSCRKNSCDFLGQAHVDLKHGSYKLEVFNDSFFNNFSESPQKVIELLKEKILKLLISEGYAPPLFFESSGPRNTEPLTENEPSNDSNDADPRNIEEIFSRLNREHFEGKITAEIGWGRESGARNNRSFRFGSYDHLQKRIRIHPRLKQEFVPVSVLELTVFHEMCHQWSPPRREKGRRLYHHAEFKRKEKEYPYYKEARDWEKQNWKKLFVPPSRDGRQ